MASRVPEHLEINGREPDQSFEDDHLLYRGFLMEEFDPIESTIKPEAVWSPDFSCNWSKYSVAADVRYRAAGAEQEGCYSFSVLISRYKDLAVPVHDPVDDPEYPNYSHTEVRARRETDAVDAIPPRKRKIRNHERKLEYRQNISNQLAIEFMPNE